MTTFSVWYTNGNIETFDLPAFSTNFGAGCGMENCFLHVDEMQEKGIRVSRSYFQSISPHVEEPVMAQFVIVEPDLLDHVYKLYKDHVEIMGQNDHGVLLDPVRYEQFLGAIAEE